MFDVSDCLRRIRALVEGNVTEREEEIGGQVAGMTKANEADKRRSRRGQRGV